MTQGFDTLSIHACTAPDPATGARQVPIYQTTAYVFHSFAFGDPNSTSGYLVPAYELTAKYGDLAKYFKSTTFSGGHEQTIVGVANGTFDAGVSFGARIGDWADGYTSGALHKVASAGLVDMNNLVEICTPP